MKTLLKNILVLSTFMFTVNLYCQQISIKQMPYTDQLPSNSVQKILQDSEGYLWFGTQDGLCRYDGYRINTYRSDFRNPDILSDNQITCIAEDKHNNLWIGTKKGISILNKSTYSISKVDLPAIKDEHIKCITISSSGKVWVGTEYNAIFLLSAPNSIEQHFSESATVENTPPGCVSDIYEDAVGNIWITGWEKGLYKYNPEHGTFTKFPRIGNHDNPHKIFQDKKKQLWICTWGDGLYLFNPNKTGEEMYTKVHPGQEKELQTDDTFYSITQDNASGYIWCISFHGVSAFRYNGDNLEEVDMSHLFLNIDKIFSEIIKDRDGNLWLGSFTEGAYCISFDKPSVNNYDIDAIRAKTGLTPYIRSICEDNNGNFWISQDRLGLCIYNRFTNQVLICNEQLHLKNMRGLKEISCLINLHQSGKIWAGAATEPIIYIIEKNGQQPNVLKQISLIKPNSPEWVKPYPRLFFEDSNNNLWIATTMGLYIKNKENDEIKYISDEFGIINGITESVNGVIWICGDNSRIFKLRRKEGNNRFHIESIDIKEYLSIDDNTNSIVADRKGNIWIGTKEGRVIKYNIIQNKCEDITLSCGMSGESIFNIVVDKFDHIWVSSNKKVIEYNSENNTYVIYSNRDGLGINFLYKNSLFENMDGDIYYGGNGGISYFTPSTYLVEQGRPSKAYIVDIRIGNRSALEGNSPVRFDRTNNILVVDAKDNNIEIHFSSLNYNFPHRIQYAYRLVGVDDNWIYSPHDRQFATYNKLSKGSYIFQIKATDENGLWNENYSVLTIIKRPAFYETWWAYLIYAVIILLCAYLIIRTFTNRIRLRNDLKIAQIEKDKAEELTQTKLRYFTNISHDLLTPLTIVSCAVDDMEITALDNNKPYTHIIRTNITKLKRLIQQILDFRKIENGKMILKISNSDLFAFISQICYTQFMPLINKKNITFSMTSNRGEINAYFDMDKIDRVMFNLLSNAIKYSADGGSIGVRIRTFLSDSKEFAEISVIDTGKGIKQEDIGLIFTRFYNNLSADASETNGIGLSLTKDLIELHHGNIKVISEINKGSTFIFTIPIDKESYISELRDNELPNTNFSDLVTVADIDVENSLSSDNPKRDDINILVVEDNLELLFLMKKSLSKYYSIYSAVNGVEALEVVRNNNIDIIVSDIMMPEMDGLTLCRTIKSNIENSHITIILLTAKNSIDDRVECYNAGADGYISKPFELKVLEARINNFIANKELRQQKFKSNIKINISELQHPTLDEEFLKNATAIIEDNLSKTDFDINAFAKSINMSNSSLYRKLKSLTGLSPVEFIRNIRLKHACNMLINKSISVSEVAYLVGFSNPKYFASCFKAEFGITPSEYQNNGYKD